MLYFMMHELRLRPTPDGGYVIEHYGTITERIRRLVKRVDLYGQVDEPGHLA